MSQSKDEPGFELFPERTFSAADIAIAVEKLRTAPVPMFEARKHVDPDYLEQQIKLAAVDLAKRAAEMLYDANEEAVCVRRLELEDTAQRAIDRLQLHLRSLEALGLPRHSAKVRIVRSLTQDLQEAHRKLAFNKGRASDTDEVNRLVTKVLRAVERVR